MRTVIIASLLLVYVEGSSLSRFDGTAKSRHKRDLESIQLKLEDFAANIRKEVSNMNAECTMLSIRMHDELESIRTNFQEPLKAIETQASIAIVQFSKIGDTQQTDGSQCLNERRSRVEAAINKSVSKLENCIERNSMGIHKTFSVANEAAQKALESAENFMESAKACLNDDFTNKELCLANTVAVAQEKVALITKDLHFLLSELQNLVSSLRERIDNCSATSLGEAGLTLNFITDEMDGCIEKKE